MSHRRYQARLDRSESGAPGVGMGHRAAPTGYDTCRGLRPACTGRARPQSNPDLIHGDSSMIRSRCDRLARRATVVALLSLAPGLARAQQPTSTPDAAKTAAAVAQLQSLS